MSPRALKVGAFLPHLEGAYEDGTAGWKDLRDIARAAEATGFDSVWVADHLLYRFPGLEFGTWECWSMVCAVAAVTERVEIGTMVSVTPWRNPGLFAKMIDTADEISGGRIIAGLGAGSHEGEFPAFGFDSWGHKVTRFAEEIEIITTLLRTGRIDHAGRFHTLKDCLLSPRGPRASGPPIMIGAMGPRMLGLVAKYADQWNIPWVHDLDTVKTQLERGAQACRDAGRDESSLSYSVALQINLPRPAGTSAGALMEQSRPQALTGSPDELAAHLRSYADAGVSHVQLWIDPATPAAIESFGEVLEKL